MTALGIVDEEETTDDSDDTSPIFDVENIDITEEGGNSDEEEPSVDEDQDQTEQPDEED